MKRQPEKKKKKQSNWMRSVGRWYYVIQYFAVHFFLFGFEFEPIMLVIKAATAFNWEAVIAALSDVSTIFVTGAKQRSSFIGTLALLWYCFKLLLASWRIILYCFVLIQFLYFLFSAMRARKHRRGVKLDKQVQIHDGAPGTGKTWLLVILSGILANLMWKKLSWLHWRDMEKVKQWKAEGNELKLSDWHEIEESYTYYTTPQDGVMPIPSLYSNIGIEREDRRSSDLTLEHAFQLERPHSYSICLYSEFGTTFSIDYSTNKQPLTADGGRLTRQWRETVILGDEQDGNNIDINQRRIVTSEWHMLGCKLILQPFLLNLIFKPLKAFFSKTQKYSKQFSNFMTGFEKLINCIGFAHFKYNAKGGMEHETKNEHKKGTFIYAMHNSIKYDTRAFRLLDHLRNKPATGKLHKSLVIMPTLKKRQAYLQSEVKNRPEIYANTNEKELLQIENSWWTTEQLKEKLARLHREQPNKYAKLLQNYPVLLDDARKKFSAYRVTQPAKYADLMKKHPALREVLEGSPAPPP